MQLAIGNRQMVWEKVLPVFLSLIFFSTKLLAQDSGFLTVQVSGDDGFVPFANVVAYGATDTVGDATDFDGIARINLGGISGQLDIKIAAVGFKPSFISYSGNGGDTLFVDMAEGDKLEEVVKKKYKLNQRKERKQRKKRKKKD